MSLAGRICAFAGFVAFFGNLVLLWNWGLTKPKAPNSSTGEVFAYNSHGVFYVTQFDLWLTRGLGILAILLIGCAVADRIQGRRGGA